MPWPDGYVGWTEYSEMLIRQEHGRVDEILTMATLVRQGNHKLVLEIPVLKYELIPICRFLKRLSHLGNDAGDFVRIDASAYPPLDNRHGATQARLMVFTQKPGFQVIELAVIIVWHHGQCHFDEHLVNGGRVVGLAHNLETELILALDLQCIDSTFITDTDD
ncbi:Uncharacterized protein KPSA3_07501 [Pseudomonas syringae pv. actinidiae]|uniref:Uncharacterized protein n=1 Tax=Pseudomonas syringae pv. actinidiae TaxID=103796 RepID=A0AAN4QDE7_PSESF|nr:Uncharacterized protein KPSA3_07501 [Pseudomonas syringae pv. actinidiae]